VNEMKHNIKSEYRRVLGILENPKLDFHWVIMLAFELLLVHVDICSSGFNVEVEWIVVDICQVCLWLRFHVIILLKKSMR